MPTPTYLFYDIETTGLNPCFDQVLQFAAIRTDLELNEIERYEYQIKLNPDVVPSPYAVITHLISLDQMREQGGKEVEVIAKIHALMNTPGTLSLGYNTLGFDDEFLRFSFHRNLLPPYTHQYANQCARLDIYPMAILYYLFRPDLITWPTMDGKPSLKLEHISAQNQLASGQAHDAMVDVIATLELARRFIQARDMWDYMLGYFDKKTDIERCDQLPIALETPDVIYRDGLLIQGKLGLQQHCMAPVLSLGQHQHYRNQTLWLRLDDERLSEISMDSIAESTWVIRKKMGEQEIILPPKPHYVDHLTAERQTLAQANRQRLLSDPDLLAAIAHYHQQYTYPEVNGIDIDAALYTLSFPNSAEARLCQQFLNAAPDDKYDLAQKLPLFMQQRAMRILARHYPEHLSHADIAQFNAECCQAQAIDYKCQHRLTWERAQEDIEKIKRERPLTPQEHTLLDGFAVTSMQN